MTVVETLLVYAGAPLAVVAVLAVLTLRPDPSTRRSRYRAGQPWEHAPVWYAPHLDHGPASGHADETKAIGSSVYGELTGSPSHDGSHGAAASGSPSAVRSGGPLGGARGTW